MSFFAPVKRFFVKDNAQFQKYVGQEEKRIRRSHPVSSSEFSHDEERLKYEILRASV